MMARFAVVFGMAAAAVAGGLGVGTASATIEDPSGNTHATCLSMRDWYIKSGVQVGPCYYDPQKDSFVFDEL